MIRRRTRRTAHRTSRTAAAGAALVALSSSSLLAACGRSAGIGPGGTAGTPSPREKLAATTQHKTTRRDLALRDARQLLADVVLPPHATPAANLNGQLEAPPQTTSGNLVDVHRFFTIQGSSPSALRDFQQHPPRGSTDVGSGSTGGSTGSSTGTTLRYLVFGWPQIPTIFNVREVLVSAARLPSGRTGIRIDAQVTWLPAKPKGDLIPPGTTELVVSLPAGPNPGQAGHKPVTISSPQEIAAIRHRINGLGVFPPGAINCPADFGQELTMIFRHGADPSPLAVVRADPAGCESVSVTEHGRTTRPVLRGGVTTYVEKLLGWRR